MIPILKKGSEWIGIVGVILGALWFIGEPMAQTFIQETVKSRIDGVEEKIEHLNKQLDESTIADIRQESDLTSVKASLNEVKESQRITESDIKAILGGVRNLQRND